MTDSEPEPSEEADPAAETPEEKRARIMARLAEMIRADPPKMEGSGPVSAGGFPMLPSEADEFDQEKAAELFGALSQFFEQRTRPKEANDADEEEEPEAP